MCRRKPSSSLHRRSRRQRALPRRRIPTLDRLFELVQRLVVRDVVFKLLDFFAPGFGRLFLVRGGYGGGCDGGSGVASNNGQLCVPLRSTGEDDVFG